MKTKPATILVIDDNEDNLITIKAIMSDVLPESSVYTALSGKEGIEYADRIDPDVILLDIVMPQMDGFEVCRRLKENTDLQRIPVVFLTALKTDREIRQKAIDAGAEGFLSKPIDELELMAQVQSMSKIKEANISQHLENERLESLVRKRTNDIEKELIKRVEAEKELVRLNNYLMKNHEEKLFIIECQKNLFKLTSTEDVFSYLTKKIHELIKSGYVITSKINEQTMNVDIADMSGFADIIEEIIKLIGFDPRKLEYNLNDLSEEEKKDFASGNLKKLGNGLYSLFLRKIPLEICSMLEKFMSIDSIYAMGIEIDGKNFGEISILSKSDISEKFETIEIIVNQAALSIQRVKTEESLKVSEERYKAIFDQSPIGISLTYSGSRMIYKANKKFKEICGRDIDENNQIDWADITHPDDLEENQKNVKNMKEKKTSGFNMSKRYVKPDGSVTWINMTIAPILSDKIEPSHLCMIEDINEKKEKQQRIEYLSYHDTLTGIYNRAFYEDSVLSFDCEDCLPLTVITGDINGLKLVNDTLGHAQGDKVLVEVARRLTKSIRESDILARIGGDEFSILMPRTTQAEAQKIVDKIYETFREPTQYLDVDIGFLSISLGLATKISMLESFDAIEKIAEDNMYKRKLLEHKSFHSSLISSMKTTLFEKSNETQEHAARLVSLAIPLGRQLNLTEEQLSELELLSGLHDIGKIGIDNSILAKRDKLTDNEWVEMKKHPDIGYRIAMASPELEPIAEYILCHHEKWDGTGYPQGVSKENIPLLSRILSIVDAYDAMTQNRPYRNALSVEVAIEEIERFAGIQFDPNIASLFVKLVRYARE